MPRIDLQHALVDLRRRAAVADLVGPQRRRLHEDVDLLGRVGQRLHAPLEDVDGLLPARLLHEQASRAPPARGSRAVSSSSTSRQASIASWVRMRVSPSSSPSCANSSFSSSLSIAAAAQLADLDEAAQRLRQLLPGAGAPVVGGDGAQGVDVLRIDLQHLLPALERVALARQLLAPDPAQALVDRDLGLGVGGRARPASRGPRSARSTRRPSRADRPGPAERDGVLAADVDAPCPTARRPCRDRRARRRRAWPCARSSRPAPISSLVDVDDLLVDAVELAPALAAEVEPLERLERLARARLVLEHGQVAGDGRVALVERLGVDLAETQVQRDQLGGVVGDGDAAGAGRPPGSRTSPGSRRCDRARPAPPRPSRARRAPARAPSRRAPDRRGRSRSWRPGAAARRAGPAGGRSRRRRLGHGGDVGVPLVRGARQPQQLVERLRRRRIFLDRLGPPAEGGDLIDQLVLGDLGQAAQQRLPLAERR